MILYIRSSTNPGPRVKRIMRYFEEMGKSTVYLSPTRADDILDNTPRTLGDLGDFDYFDGKGFYRYIKFLLSVNLAVAKKIYANRRTIDLVHFSDLEVVLFGGLICRLVQIPFVYNIHDNFFQRYEYNIVVGGLLKYLESFYILLSAVTVVPEVFRKTVFPLKCWEKIEIVRNYPDFDTRIEFKPTISSRVRLFYGGWISPNRSIYQYSDLALALRNRGFGVEVIMCGWGNKDYIASLSENMSVDGIEFKYLGHLSQNETIIWLQKSDISIAYYSPDKAINILAASNKIPEVLGSNTILITNRHTEIAQALAPLEISLQFDESVHEVVDELISLLGNTKELQRFLERASNHYSREYSPEKLKIAMESAFRNIGT